MQCNEEAEHGADLRSEPRAGGNRSEAEDGSMSGKDRIERVADELRRLESEGGTLDDILNGEAGWCWIEEACFDRWAVIEEMHLLPM